MFGFVAYESDMGLSTTAVTVRPSNLHLHLFLFIFFLFFFDKASNFPSVFLGLFVFFFTGL